MQEQGIAWMISGALHDPSPEELRYMALRDELRRSRPTRPWRERLAAAIGGCRLPTLTATTPATDCCPA